MIYASPLDLVERFGEREVTQLTDRAEPPAGDMDEAVADAALADASAEIDAYVGSAYSLPLPSVPDVLRRLCCDIARYRLWADDASEEVRRRYEDAVRLLERIAKGVATLGFSEPPPVSSGGPEHSAPARIMKDLRY